MKIKLIDNLSGKVIVADSMDTLDLAQSSIKDILARHKLTIDDFGNIRTFLGDFTNFHISHVRVLACEDAA